MASNDDLTGGETEYEEDETPTQPRPAALPMEHKDYEFRRRHYELDGIDLLHEFLKKTKVYRKRYTNMRKDKIFILTCAARCIREYKLACNVFIEVLCQLLYHCEEMQTGLISIMNKYGEDMSRDHLFKCFKVPNSAAESIEEVHVGQRRYVKKIIRQRKKAKMEQEKKAKEEEEKAKEGTDGKKEETASTSEKSENNSEQSKEKTTENQPAPQQTTNNNDDSKRVDTPVNNMTTSNDGQQVENEQVVPKEKEESNAIPPTRSRKRNHQEKPAPRRSKRTRRYTYKMPKDFMKK